MKSKTLVPAILFGVALLFGTLLFISGKENGTSVVSADSFPRNIPTLTPYPTAVLPGVSVMAIQKFADSGIQTTSANGIEISAANFRVEDKILKVDVCFQKPSNENWLIFDAAIQIGEAKITLDGGSGIEETTTLDNGQRKIFTFANRTAGISGQEQTVIHDGMPDYRCDTLDFQVDSSLKLSQFDLVINSIMLDRNEGGECTTYRDRVQSILDAQGLGIRIDCVMQDYGSFQTIAEKPASMSQEEAERLVRNARREAFMLHGPWIFQGTISQ